MDIDKCLLTKIDDQVFVDQTFKINLNAPPVTLVYKQFEDWVTRDAIILAAQEIISSHRLLEGA